MNLSKNIALLLSLLLITCSIFTSSALPIDDDGTNTEKEEQKWWENWDGDKNHNRIEDIIEELGPEERIGIYIDYDRHPNQNDVSRLTKFDFDVKYVYKYIDVICARNVAVSDVEELSYLPHVVMIKLEPKIYAQLDISARAIKARESNDYSPNTAAELGVTGEGISIAILDSGVDDGGYFPNQRHESLDDLDDNPATNDLKRRAGVDFTQDESFLNPRDGTYDPDDIDGHGTHCAGIAIGTGGEENTYIGIAPQARLIDVKIIENYGAGNAGDSIAGIEWCIDHMNEFNIRILSCSYGSMFGESDGSDEESQTVNNAVDAGLVVVVAIGNDPLDVNRNLVPSPAAADKAIAVGSVYDRGTINRNDDTLSTFSYSGPRLDDGDDDKLDELKPDVVAYGENIMAPQANSAANYESKSGTSMACPHVSGVVALMLDANPSLTPDQVKMILRVTAESRGTPSYPDLDPKYNTVYGWGIVDAYKAVNLAMGFREVGISLDHPLDGETIKGTVEISGTAYIISGSGEISSIEVSIDDPDFQTYNLEVEGTSIWSTSWDTEGLNGHRTIYARARSGNYTATASIEVMVDNPDASGDGELNPEEGPPKINLPFGIGRVSLYAAIAFIAIIAGIIIAIVAVILLRRRKMYMKMIAARRAEQDNR
jgi:serine protease AprX